MTSFAGHPGIGRGAAKIGPHRLRMPGGEQHGMSVRQAEIRARFAAERQAKRNTCRVWESKPAYSEAAEKRKADRETAENCRILGFAWLFFHCWPLHEEDRSAILPTPKLTEIGEHLF